MTKQDQLKLESLERRVKELEADKEYAKRQSNIWDIGANLTNPMWWDTLTPDQFKEVTDILKAANKIWFDRVGISVQFVEHKYQQ